jgi:Tol biopolymer transport system component
LRKSQDDRYQTAKEMLDDLRKLKQIVEIQARIESGSAEELLAGLRTRESGAQASAGAVTRSNIAHLRDKIRLHKKAAIIISAALVVALAAVAFWIDRPTGQSKLAMPFQATHHIRINTPRNTLDAALSPDGKYVAYVTREAERQTVWLKQLPTNTDTQIVPPAEMSYRYLTFSPDGNYLYYHANKKNEPRALYQMSAAGGPARKLPVRLTHPFSFSPDGKRLAFVRRPSDVERAVIVSDVDGGEEQVLATVKLPEAFDPIGPSWSPDGKTIVCAGSNDADVYNLPSYTPVEVRLADGTIKPITQRTWPFIAKFSWLRDGSGLVLVAMDYSTWGFQQLWFLSYPGGQAHKITNDLSDYSPYHLSLTADSIAILALKSDRVCNIWVAPDANASRAKQITFGPAGRGDGLMGLSWTPDGRLVYDSFVFNNQAVFIMNADGSGAMQLTGGDYIAADATTTSDGTYIAFTSIRLGKMGIWRMDIDGNNPRLLTNQTTADSPACSPDGKWVFYREGERMLYKVPIDGGESIRVFDKECVNPAVSPDGKLVAFAYVDEQASAWRVGVISAETGQLLTPLEFRPDRNIVRWTPDGRAVAYIKTEGGVSNIWAQALDGDKPAPLTDFKSDRIFNFAWSNDGKQLAIARGTETSDVVLIKDLR